MKRVKVWIISRFFSNRCSVKNVMDLQKRFDFRLEVKMMRDKRSFAVYALDPRISWGLSEFLNRFAPNLRSRMMSPAEI